MTVQEKLLHIQQNLKAPKNQYNSFGDYHYRNCEDILEALKPLLAEVKAVILIRDDVVLIGDRFYIKATATLQDAESQDNISNTAYARETEQKPKMDAAQITGSCSSYARKYALNGLFCIDDAKDPDTQKPPEPQEPKGNNRQQGSKTTQNRQQNATQKPTGAEKGNKAVYVNQRQMDTIRAEIERTGAKEKAVCYQYHISRLEDMTIEQFNNAMLIFSQMQSKAPEPDYMDQYQMTLEEMAQYETDMSFR